MTAQLLELISRETLCYETVISLSVKQQEVLDSGDTDLLLSIVNKKQEYILRIRELQDRCNRLNSQWEARHAGEQSADRDRLRAAAGRLAERIAEAVRLEKLNISRVETLKEEIDGKMKSLRRGRETMYRYAAAPEGGRFMDQRL